MFSWSIDVLPSWFSSCPISLRIPSFPMQIQSRDLERDFTWLKIQWLRRTKTVFVFCAAQQFITICDTIPTSPLAFSRFRSPGRHSGLSAQALTMLKSKCRWSLILIWSLGPSSRLTQNVGKIRFFAVEVPTSHWLLAKGLQVLAMCLLLSQLGRKPAGKLFTDALPSFKELV